MKAVPTVCLALLQHLEATQQRLKHLRLICVGGSACPPSTIQARSLSSLSARGVSVQGAIVRHPSRSHTAEAMFPVDTYQNVSVCVTSMSMAFGNML